MSDPRAWGFRKSNLNHRRLHNRFILGLRAAEKDLAAGRAAPEGEMAFLEEARGEWPRLRDDIALIVRECEREVSPGSLFDDGPLSGLPPEDRAWMRPLVVVLWKKRYKVEEAVAECEEALRQADAVWLEVSKGGGTMSTEGRREGLRAFCEACEKVSRALSGLPSGERRL